MSRLIPLLAVLLALAGCLWRASPATGTGTGTGGETITPGHAVQLVSAWSAGLAGIALLIAPVLAWFGQGYRAAQLAILAATVIVSAGILAWIGTHLWLLSLASVVLGLLCCGVLAWKYRKRIEKAVGIDLVQDGKIGK
jgi:hypothetical protein